MEALRTEAASSEEHFMRIRRVIADHQPRCVVIDPLSALARVGGGLAARAVAERLIYLCRNQGITVLFTSLAEGTDPQLETTTLHISTIADSWIQLSYALQSGERNRALTIIKSRGSKHSNQLRELVFGDKGITLADSYAAHGEVLMGTLRIEKENAMRAEAERMRHEIEQKRREIEVILAERDLRLEAAQRDLRDRSEELDRLRSAQRTSIEEGILRQDEMVHQRDGDLLRKSAPAARPATRKPTSAKTKKRRRADEKR
jgi:circadian clock protein KaiC